MGFGDVYDYAPGKLDWLARGLPSEGTKADEPTASSVARADAPTCGLDDRVSEVRDRVERDGICVVVNEVGVVAGILGAEQVSGTGDVRAEEAMRPGPSTFRPNVPIAEMARYLTEHDLASAPVTSADGRLLGVLFREDAVRVAGDQS